MGVDSKYKKLAAELVQKHPYFLLAKSWCPDVKYTIATLERVKKYHLFYTYELDKLADQKEAAEIEKAFTELAGRKWVPAIFINGQYWGNEQSLKKLEAEDRLDEFLDQIK